MKQFILNSITLIVVLLSLILISSNIHHVYDLFRLNGSNTVYEYQISSTEESQDWLSRMCNNGYCLDNIDWQCGFEISGDFEMNQCFIDTARTAQPWVPLDIIRKYCGKKYANFTEHYGPYVPDKNSCEEHGGTWGEIKYNPVIPTITE